MRVIYDPRKRDLILARRGLDFARANLAFDGFHLTRSDPAHSDMEERFITVGLLDGSVVIIVWTERDGTRRVITMWKANERERELYFRQRERSEGNEAGT